LSLEKQAEEAQRDDCTVLVNRINLNANEKDIYGFFAKGGVGKIRDVRLIRDQRSGKSKGYD
jgi:RNA-binding protein 39